MQDNITIMDEVSGGSGIITDNEVDDKEPLDFTPERHEDETLEEYHARQKKANKSLKRFTITQMFDEDNREARRKKARKVKIRMTKPLRVIRNGRKIMMGEYDVTKIVKEGGDVLAYVKEQYKDTRDLIDELDDTSWERERGDIKIWED